MAAKVSATNRKEEEEMVTALLPLLSPLSLVVVTDNNIRVSSRGSSGSISRRQQQRVDCEVGGESDVSTWVNETLNVSLV